MSNLKLNLFKLLIIFLLLCPAQIFAVGKWEREVISFTNNSYSGNPFELEMDAIFTHNSSGATITLPGYYAGNNVWKVGFMPTQVGTWSYVTSSSDSDLNNQTGSIQCTSSSLPGLLKNSEINPKKWKFADGPYIIPIGLQFSVLLEDVTLNRFESAADFLATKVKGHLFNFRINPNDIAFSSVSNKQFDLALWDRLEQRMEILRDKGLGISIMFYTDDSGKPSFAGKSSTEALLIRYAVARLAGYPVVVFNTGIDIREYRDSSDINWWGSEIAKLDPYNHPRSSRYGGGSGSVVLQGQSYDSRGASTARINDLISFYNSANNIPIAVDDNWGEQFSRGNFSPSDIRRAFWKVTIAGGIGSHIRDDRKSDFPNANDPDAWFHANNMESKLESEQWLALINPFIQNNLGDTFGIMKPSNNLVTGTGAYCLADTDNTNILVYLIGDNDKFDNGGGNVTLNLTSTSKQYSAIWFDTRTGNETIIGTISGGSDHTFTPPSNDDWVLYLNSGGPAISPPNPPSNIMVN